MGRREVFNHADHYLFIYRSQPPHSKEMVSIFPNLHFQLRRQKSMREWKKKKKKGRKKTDALRKRNV